MKTIQIHALGGPEVLQVVETEVPSPAVGQVRVKVAAAGINFADTLQRAGRYPLPLPLPFVPGFEVAGTVETLGPGVSTAREGDRVAVLLPAPGGYAEYITVDAGGLIAIPDGVTFAQATALLAQGLTAYLMLEHTVALRAGQSVLVHAAAGGVGSLLVQLAKIRGGRVIGTASTGAKLDLIRALGGDEAIDYTESGWVEAVKAATGGQGAEVIFDSVGGSIGQESFGCLAPFGRLVVYGAMSLDTNHLSSELITRMIFQNQSVSGFAIYGFTPQQIGAALGALFGYLLEGRLQVVTRHAFPLVEAATAHQAIENRQTTGKVILLP
jgi:NADPH2:quinone reductase